MENSTRGILLRLWAIFLVIIVICSWLFINFRISFEAYSMALATFTGLFVAFFTGMRTGLIFSMIAVIAYGSMKMASILWFHQSQQIGASQLFWLIVLPLLTYLGGSLREIVDQVTEKFSLLGADLEDIVVVDELTGLENAKRYALRVVEEVARARRYGGEFSLLLFKIAYLEDLEDVHGTRIRKMVVKRVADVLKEGKRYEDFLCCLGRDEFGFLLPATPREGALIMQERLRAKLDHIDLKPEDGDFRRIRLTIRSGMACYPEDGDDYIPLLNVARRGYEYDMG